MGIYCKPVGKFKGTLKKVQNQIDKEKAALKAKKEKKNG